MAKINIMIVEDDAITAMDIENQLKNLGYGVSAKVSNGEKAIQKAKENTPDLVLMDIVLKGEMDGIEAAEEIHTQYDIPVVFLTAFADKERLKRAKLSNPFGFILKPFQDKDFQVTIEMALYVAKVDAERKQTEEALQNSEERFRNLAEMLPEVVFETNRNLEITYANRRAFELLGYSVEDLKRGLNGLEMLSPEDRDRAKANIAMRLKGEDPGTVEYQALRKDGSSFPVLFHASSIIKEGELFGLRGIIFDITERKQAEEALRDREKRYRNLFENMLNGFAYCQMLYKDGRPDDFIYLDVNKTFGKLTGLRNVVGKKVTEVISGIKEETPELFDIYARVAETSSPEQFEIDFTPLDIWLNISVYSPQKGYFVAVFDNITERKKAEEAQRKSERELSIRNEINSIFLTHPDEEIYAEILKVILKVMESEYGTFGYFDDDGSFVAPAVTRKIYWEKCNVPEKEIIFQKGTFGGIWGKAIKERKTLISNEGPFKVPEGHIPIVNTMVAPIIFRDEVISAIHIANNPDGYDEESRTMLRTIADNIAPVLYARLQRDKLM